MLCPFCEGTGKCYQQTITYEEVETNRTNKYLTKCFKCNGTGEIEQTNFEYMQSCSIEELAESLLDVWDGIDDVINKMSEDGEISKKDAIIWWLKQPHNK